MKKVLLMSCCWLIAISLQAQQRTVTGKVFDATDNTPLPGVSILIKGTSAGTTSDAEGNFSIDTDPASVLVFSFIGFESQEVLVGDQTSIQLTMKASVNQLEEIVVIGYGEREKKDLTGSISSVGAESISKSPSVTPELAMQGRMTGVFVSSPGGNPNARPVVRIRGTSTFNNAEPLYVVDGVPIMEFGSNGAGVEGDIRGNINIFTLINPGDIESISVLKDAAASAIYGARASNGVVLITTKKGKKGAPKVEFNALRGVQNFNKTYDVLNTQQFTSLYQEMFDNDTEYRRQYAPGADPGAPYTWDIPGRSYLNVFNPASASYLGNSPTYDWQSELQNRDAVMEDYSVRVSGGNESTTYYVGGGYARTESPLIQNYLERYTLSSNVQSKISNVLETGMLYRVTYQEALDNTKTDLQTAAHVTPWQPIYDVNDPTGFARTTDIAFIPNPDFDMSLSDPGPARLIAPGTDQLRPWGNESSYNPFANQALSTTDYSMLKNFGNVYLQVTPIKGLRIRGGVSIDWTYIKRNDWEETTQTVRFSETPGNPYTNQDGNAVGTYSERHSRNINIISDITVGYAKSFGDHNIDLLFNASTQRFNYQHVGGSSPVRYVEPEYRGIGDLPRFNTSGTIRDARALQGYVGRISYNYKDKYYIDGSIRRDGSSDYAKDYRWGTFPGVSAAWRISGEEFFAGNVPFIDDLKLRAGYGTLGNTFSAGLGLSKYAFLSLLNINPDYSLGSGNGNGTGSQVQGAYFPTLANLELTWEKAKTFNVGIDGAALKNRLTFTVEYYNKNTEGIIQQVGLPASSGVEDPVDYNVASVRNSGVELEMGYTHNIGALELSLSGNFTTVKNRVTALYLDRQLWDAGLVVGHSVGFIYGYRKGGIFQNEAEIQEWKDAGNTDAAGANPRPGDMWFRDIYGAPDAAKGEKYKGMTPDGTVNANDRDDLGKTIPGFFYGVNLGAKYKGFDLSLFFQGVGDVYRYNSVRHGGEQMDGTGLNFWTTTNDRWTPENPSSEMPRAIFGDPNQNNRGSDRFVEKASFLRLKNMQLGYTLPRSILDHLKVVNSFRIYFSGTNLFTATKWTGIDPENDFIPPTRVLSVGLNASF
jgi:TonB-linked SusC/RagA family outer membrane protein